jgi:hypothetical protein
MPDDTDLAMQLRCVQCRRENYALAVKQISQGGYRCVCGHVSRPMTLDEYRAAVRAAKTPTYYQPSLFDDLPEDL